MRICSDPPPLDADETIALYEGLLKLCIIELRAIDHCLDEGCPIERSPEFEDLLSHLDGLFPDAWPIRHRRG